MKDDFDGTHYSIRNLRFEVGMVKVQGKDGIDTYRIPGKGGTLKVIGELIEYSDGLIIKEI